jgi:hypothetical protein
VAVAAKQGGRGGRDRLLTWALGLGFRFGFFLFFFSFFSISFLNSKYIFNNPKIHNNYTKNIDK